MNETLLDATGMKPGDKAGLAAFQSNYCAIGVEVDDNGKRFVVATRGSRRDPKEVMRMPLKGKKVWLRMKYVFTPQADDTCGPDKAFMSYSTDGRHWVEVDNQLQMRFTLDFFIGYKAKQAGGHADFDYFRQWTY